MFLNNLFCPFRCCEHAVARFNGYESQSGDGTLRKIVSHFVRVYIQRLFNGGSDILNMVHVTVTSLFSESLYDGFYAIFRNHIHAVTQLLIQTADASA